MASCVDAIEGRTRMKYDRDARDSTRRNWRASLGSLPTTSSSS
jgi:hypothetical protein